MKSIRITKAFTTILALLLFGLPNSLFAQGTSAFTYQGQLRDGGTNANGSYTMIFALYDSATNGTQIGLPSVNPVTLVNGLFTVNLDFGPNSFDGNSRWLDITVQCATNAETLWPRVQVMPTPYALFASVAGTVTNGAISGAQLAPNAVTTTNIQAEAITATQIAFHAVTTDQIADGSITSAKLAPLTPFHGMLVITNPSTYIFTNPIGVSQLFIEAWGAGGGGGGGTRYWVSDPEDYPNTGGYWTGETDGGGGGAGGYARGFIAVTNDPSYVIHVGAGGTTGTDGPLFGTSGQDGGATSFGNLFVCGGGKGGSGGIADVQEGIAGAGGQAQLTAPIRRNGESGSDWYGGMGVQGSLWEIGRGGNGGGPWTRVQSSQNGGILLQW